MRVVPLLCSNCLPYDIEHRCLNCDHVFQVEIREDASIVVNGEVFELLLLVSCPDCGASHAVDTELGEAIRQ